ncbi:alkaline phosphatase family protein [candidate division KSB1 bacterium]|nr:alkaline phosphatase family protein [candidate division KSB1 bacterium]
MMIDCPQEQLGAVFKNLKQNENNFKVYLKKDVPEYFHFSNHPLISPILIIADPGWSLQKGKLKTLVYGAVSKGNHGYDNFHLDMHGIFYAAGPSFKKEYRCGTIWNIDIYPLLCKILGIFPRQNIDGKFERIGFILKN